MTRRRLCVQDYTVGLVCALLIELATAMTMLDEEHHDLETTMTLTYTLSATLASTTSSSHVFQLVG